MAGLRFAGTKNANVQELLYDYAVYFLNEVIQFDHALYKFTAYLVVKTYTLISADQACLHYKWKCLSKGIVSLCRSMHTRNMPSPGCSFLVCGK